jgi:hypothetical protein
MKIFAPFILLALLALASQTVSLAENAAPPEPPAENPCKVVEAACEAAGFLPRQHKQAGKALWMDCLRPLMNGQSVPGVRPPTSTLSACKAHRAKRRQNDQQQQ